MYNAAKAGLEGVDETLEKVARTLGASEARVFLTVTLPLAWPGLGTGLVLSFVRALGEFGATLMVAGNIPGKTQTVATAVWAATETGDMRTATLLVGIMLIFGFAAVWASRLGSEWGFGRHVQARRG
jgi:molybdate transport system permease protein